MGSGPMLAIVPLLIRVSSLLPKYITKVESDPFTLIRTI